jgi:hypothetical protein
MSATAARRVALTPVQLVTALSSLGDGQRAVLTGFTSDSQRANVEHVGTLLFHEEIWYLVPDHATPHAEADGNEPIIEKIQRSINLSNIAAPTRWSAVTKHQVPPAAVPTEPDDVTARLVAATLRSVLRMADSEIRALVSMFRLHWTARRLAEPTVDAATIVQEFMDNVGTPPTPAPAAAQLSQASVQLMHPSRGVGGFVHGTQLPVPQGEFGHALPTE